MFIKTNAICLHNILYGDTSKITILLTQTHGLISAIIKGVRKPQSPWYNIVEPANMVEVVLYYRPTRSVQLLKECTLNNPFLHLKGDIKKWSCTLFLLYLTYIMAQEQHAHEEANKKLYHYILNFLTWYDTSHHDWLTVIPYALIRMAELSGIKLQFNTTLQKNNIMNHIMYFNIENGTISNHKDNKESIQLKGNTLNYMYHALVKHSKKLFELPYHDKEQRILLDCLLNYFIYHKMIEPKKMQKIKSMLKNMFYL